MCGTHSTVVVAKDGLVPEGSFLAAGPSPGAVETRGPSRYGTVECDVQEEYVYNGDFEVVGGGQHFVDGELRFPTPQHDHDSFYRTRFGFNFDTDAVTFARSDHNQRLAARRLTGTRVPDRPGYHQFLRDSQYFAIADHAAFFRHLRLLYQPFFEQHLDLCEEIEAHYLDPHEKRELRKAAWLELKQSCGAYLSDTWLKGKVRKLAHVAAKMKPEEYAKPGKKPRLIGDLGVAASLLGFRYAEFLKTAQAETLIEYAGGYMVFCKSPEVTKMKELFSKLHDPPGRFFFVFFSDDSTLAYRRPDGSVAWHNLDISSCDVSHTQYLFELLVYLTPDHMQHVARQLVDQCSAPIKFRSIHNRRLTVTLKPKFAKLYSGSTITTAINNLACILIMACIADHPVITPETIRLGAERAGYIMTGCESLPRFEKVQFLKHSPVDTPNGWYPTLNLGVVLRLSGNCKRDLPGRGPLKPRAHAFQTQLLSGAFSHFTSPMIRGMKAMAARHTYQFTKREQVQVDSLVKHRAFQTSKEVQEIEDEKYLARYDLNGSQIREIIDTLPIVGFGQVYTSSALDAIFNEDYGLHRSTDRLFSTNDDHPRWPVAVAA